MEALKKLSFDCLVIVDFFATWCGPCKSVKVAYERLAEEEPTIKFAKLDIDEYEVRETVNQEFFSFVYKAHGLQ